MRIGDQFQGFGLFWGFSLSDVFGSRIERMEVFEFWVFVHEFGQVFQAR
ncbi:MAG: hypothetical protein LBH03_06120 [Holophagales bacterium]|jgi:hypothetical protein|nr:hypothetical protein [Holophagales bacterium]